LPNTYNHNGRLTATFRDLRLRNEGALIAYLTGGDPTPQRFQSNAEALVEGGTDILEVGIPFSDPIADGPVIQTSSHRALSGGATPSRIFRQVRRLSKTIDVPIVLLTYYNPVLAFGLYDFMRAAEDSGVNGVVVPDLPAEESGPLVRAARNRHVDTIFLISPNTSPERAKMILDKSRGFLYLVSLFGVTGPRIKLGRTAVHSVRRVKKLARNGIPIAAGFGISKPEHVSALIQAGADGAIVGSALVEIVNRDLDRPETMRTRLLDLILQLKAATKSKSRA
jgi:tryptophan synthase alpha chain